MELVIIKETKCGDLIGIKIVNVKKNILKVNKKQSNLS